MKVTATLRCDVSPQGLRLKPPSTYRPRIIEMGSTAYLEEQKRAFETRRRVYWPMMMWTPTLFCAVDADGPESWMNRIHGAVEELSEKTGPRVSRLEFELARGSDATRRAD